MKTKSLKSIIYSGSILLVISIAIILCSQFNIQPEWVEAQTATVVTSSSTAVTRLSEYAWSENIGWISFKDGSKPVTLGTDGSLSGYAWSENIGWIQFGGLSGFPDSSRGKNAKIEGDKITGWARVISGIPPADLTLDNRGGFDGWILLSGSSYGVNVNGSVLNGYAWGSIVTGWIDMSGVRITTLLRPCMGPYGTNIPDGQNFVFYSQPNSSGECTSQVRTCTNGNLSGAYNEISCGDTSMCTRGGKAFNAGDKVVFFAKAIAGQGQTCESLEAELECKDGAFVDKNGNFNNLNKSLKCINNPSYTEK